MGALAVWVTTCSIDKQNNETSGSGPVWTRELTDSDLISTLGLNPELIKFRVEPGLGFQTASTKQGAL